MLEELFLSFLNVSLQMTVVIILIFLLDRILNKWISSQAKCLAWFLLCIRLLVPIIFPLPFIQDMNNLLTESGPSVSAPSIQSNAMVQQTLPAYTHSGSSEMVESHFYALIEPFYKNFSMIEIAAVVWITVVGILFTFYLIGYFLDRYFLLKHSTTVMDEEYLNIFRQVKQEVGVKMPLELRLSSKVESPMLLGFFRSVLFLPHMEFSPEALKVIFLHEFMHYKRRDLFYKLLLVVTKCFHWFNPFVHMMIHKAEMDLESACDDAVLRGREKRYRQIYGNVLLDVLSEKKRYASIWSTHFAGDTKMILKRFHNIVDLKPKRWGPVFICMAIALTLLLTSTLNPVTAKVFNADAISLQKVTSVTPQDFDQQENLLAHCLESSVFEQYKPYQHAFLEKEDFIRCEEAERTYRGLLKTYPEGTQLREYLENPTFLIINKQVSVTNGLFCCQTNNDRIKGNERFRMIWLDFSNLSDLQVMDLGTAYPNKGRFLDKAVEDTQKKKNQAYETAQKFGIDLAQYRQAFSDFDPAIIENRADSLSWSLQKQLKTKGRYQFEQFDRNQMTAFIKKDNTEGIMVNTDRSGEYIHYFQVPTLDARNAKKTLEGQFPIVGSECSP